MWKYYTEAFWDIDICNGRIVYTCVSKEMNVTLFLKLCTRKTFDCKHLAFSLEQFYFG